MLSRGELNSFRRDPKTSTVGQMDQYNPIIVKMLSETYGSLCAQILLHSASSDIREVLQALTPSRLSSILRQHTNVDPDMSFRAWNDKVLHVNHDRPISPVSRCAIIGQPISPPLSSSLLPKRAWDLEDLQAMLSAQRISSSPISPKSFPTNIVDVFFSPSPPVQGWTSKTRQQILSPPISPEPHPQQQAIKVPKTTPAFVPAMTSEIPISKFGRGVIIKHLPVGITLARICRNVAGGKVERIDFQDGEDRAVVGIYFVNPEAAHNYWHYVNANGGINWGGTRRSFVDLIPAHMGGSERIKQNVQSALDSEAATRCLKITGVSSRLVRGRLMSDIIHQSKNIRPAFESCDITRVGASRSRRLAVVRMGSIGTALGARLVLSRNPYYQNTTYKFLPDPCDRGLETLGAQWAVQEAADSMGRLDMGRIVTRARYKRKQGDIEESHTGLDVQGGGLEEEDITCI